MVILQERSALSSLQHSYTSPAAGESGYHGNTHVSPTHSQLAASFQDAKRSECSEEHYHHLVEECARLRQQLHTDHTHYATILSGRTILGYHGNTDHTLRGTRAV